MQQGVVASMNSISNLVAERCKRMIDTGQGKRGPGSYGLGIL